MDESVRARFQRLLDAARPFAERMLREEGEFIPFAATLNSAGTVALLAGDVGVERPASTAVIEFLRESLSRLSTDEQVVAAAICFMGVATGRNTDVAVFQMCDVWGNALEIYLPYRILAKGEVEFGQITAARGDCFLPPFSKPDK
ncbi:MAG: hypothetical protein N2688_02640 [Burkholderiaceae bacterium]|nr:hypothetical protein [Burkholderiaceae bacterium]